MSEATTNIGRTECIGLIGPIRGAWEQTFQPGSDEALGPCLVIVWHSEWMNPRHGLWNALYDQLNRVISETRILVVIFGDTPDDLRDEQHGNPLGVLLRALAEDATASDDSKNRGCGWATISDVSRFKSASVNWKKPSRSALLQFCQTCAELSTYWNKSPRIEIPVRVPNLSEFFQFLSDPASFRARSLHDKPDDAAQSLRSPQMACIARHHVAIESAEYPFSRKSTWPAGHVTGREGAKCSCRACDKRPLCPFGCE